MTELSQTILERYQIRKTAKQKQGFIDLLQSHFPQLQLQAGGFPKSRNLIIGDVETAKVVLTAHYDTCPKFPVPNFITPKNPLLSILYSIAILIPVFLSVFLLNLLIGLVSDNYWVHYWISLVFYFGFIYLLLAGPANKHTANDNTSGVVTLCEILQQMSPEDQKKTAVVFFDNEEIGLIGSGLFRKIYKKQMQDKLLVNLDCVSDGNHILLAISKNARATHYENIEACFRSTDEKHIMLEKAEKVYYPSDQAGFKNAIAVAALKHNRFFGYYMDRIHTSRDTVFDEENIRLLCACTLAFVQTL